MSVKLQKGQKVSLSKEQPGLSKIIVGLGWDAVQQQRKLFALLLTDGRLSSKDDIVYFGNLNHKSKSVMHMGDNLTGQGDGDDEQIVIDLDKVPAQNDKIVLAVNIYKAYDRRQHFGMIENAFIRLVDSRNNQEICIYNLSENYSGKTAMLFGEVYRYNGEWKFGAIGQGTNDGSIGDFIKRYV